MKSLPIPALVCLFALRFTSEYDDCVIVCVDSGLIKFSKRGW